MSKVQCPKSKVVFVFNPLISFCLQAEVQMTLDIGRWTLDSQIKFWDWAQQSKVFVLASPRST